MPANFIRIENEGQLEELFLSSVEKPVAIFKHSATCGISAHVMYMMEEVDGDVHVVTVQSHRPLSNAIAERTGHRHQSPQAFVVRNGKAIYHATHYGIDPKTIDGLLNS